MFSCNCHHLQYLTKKKWNKITRSCSRTSFYPAFTLFYPFDKLSIVTKAFFVSSFCESLKDMETLECRNRIPSVEKLLLQ